MLINFTVENWMSFRDPTSFSMVASRERQHGERVPRLKKYQMRVLPVSVIYGGNASGKTNLFKAIYFAKSLIVRVTPSNSLIQVKPFKLERSFVGRPSRFSFELLIEDTIYEFTFSVTRKAVVEEKLVQILGSTERIIYERQGEKLVSLDNSLSNKQYLHFAFQGTRNNQLFLTNSVSQKVMNFKPIYDWFNDTLELVAPDSRFSPLSYLFRPDELSYNDINKIIAKLDTGVLHLCEEEIPFKDHPMASSRKAVLSKDLEDGDNVITYDSYNRTLKLSRKEDEIYVKKLVSYHRNVDGVEIKFDLEDESDGTQRLLSLIPVFLELTDPRSNKVFVIDEIDRSLHTLLLRQLIESYLDSCSSNTRSQLLFTTHDVLLMDQKLFRRDEMWITKRARDGATSVLSFSEFKDVRYDKDIRKSYLEGRLGGVPRILLSGSLAGDGRCSTDDRENG